MAHSDFLNCLCVLNNFSSFPSGERRTGGYLFYGIAARLRHELFLRRSAAVNAPLWIVPRPLQNRLRIILFDEVC